MAKQAEIKLPAQNSKRIQAENRAEVPDPKVSVSKDRFLLIAGIAGFAMVLVIYLLRLDHTVGLIQDDAWYVMLAKAMATGQGYTLINSPTAGIMPFYPPAFPVVLSLVFRIAPQFPQNLWLLKSVGVASMLGVGVVTYFYLTGYRQVQAYAALGVALATMTTPPFVFLATSTAMSEPFFTLAQILTVLVIERCVREREQRRWLLYLILGAGLAAVTFLTRSMALGLVLAIPVYFAKERLWRSAVVFAVGVAVFVGPWMIYSRLHAPTPEQRAEQHGNIVINYAEQFWHREAGIEASGQVTAADLPARVWNAATLILGREVGRVTVSSFYPAFRLENRNTSLGLLSFLLSVLAIVGYLAAARTRITLIEIALLPSLGIILLWPWEPLRFLLPFVPFLLYYMLNGLGALYAFSQRASLAEMTPKVWLPLSAVIGCFILFHLYDHVAYIAEKYGSTPAAHPAWLRYFDENLEMMNWIKEKLPPEAILAAQNPPMVYLYTGRKTVAMDDPVGNWENWNRIGVRYLARTSPLPVGPLSGPEAQYRLVYQSKGRLGVRVIDFGPPESRARWGRVSGFTP